MTDYRQRNKDVITEFYEAVNSHHREVFFGIVADDFVNHGGASGDIVGPKALVDSLDPFYGAMPDWHVSKDWVIAEDDKVASRGTVSGTHQGPFMGIPPTGKAMAWTGTIVYRLNDDGKVVERWQDFDALSMLTQMGVVPGPGGGPTGGKEAPVGAGDPDGNTAIVHKAFDVLNGHDPAGLAGLVADGYVDNDPAPGQAPGLAGLQATEGLFVHAFPDIAYDVKDTTAEGDLVCARLAVTGTNSGDFMGIPPTNKAMHWTEHRTFRVADGVITEGWTNLDMVGIFQQLGLIPPFEA